MAKISVVVPVYNVESYLNRCIDSILNQSFADFKLILVDDGSTDRSGEICEEYKEKDDRVEVIHQENMGLSMARNAGIEHSTEEYISFIDSDDYIHKDMFKVLYDSLEEKGGDVSICQYQLSYDDERLDDEDYENQTGLIDNLKAVNMIVEESNANVIVAWGKLYKKSLFENISYPRGKYHEDEFITYKILYKAKNVAINTARLYYYTQRKDSIMGEKYNLKRLEKLEALKEAIEFFKDLGEKDLETKARLRYLLNLQIAYFKVKHEMEETDTSVLEKLKDEYDREYKSTSKHGGKIRLRQRVMLKFFQTAPDRYCDLVKRVMKRSKK